MMSRLPFSPEIATHELIRGDRTLARLIEAAGPFTLELQQTQGVFEVLTESITHQQLNGRAARIIHGRLCQLFPQHDGVPHPEALLQLSDDSLRGAGLSNAKVRALRDLASRTLAGELPDLSQIRRMDDQAIIDVLTRVRGIGTWTVQMLLIFRLGRPDVFPADDFGIRKGFQLFWRKGEMPKPRELLQRAERWRPWRSVAAWYLWRAVDLHRAQTTRQEGGEP